MPFRDRTGPEGKGPMTGRASGYCAETDVPVNTYPQGRGRGPGGRRQGRGIWAAPAAILPEQEVNVLRSNAQSLKDVLQRVNDRLDMLKKAEGGD